MRCAFASQSDGGLWFLFAYIFLKKYFCYPNKLELKIRSLKFTALMLIKVGDRGGTVVKVLFYKSEGLWFDPI